MIGGWWIWDEYYYWSPKSLLSSTDPGNNSTYTQADYLARPAGNWGPSFQSQQIQGPSYGTTANNNYGSDYFTDSFGYQNQVGGETYAPATSPTEPVTYGAGQWVTVLVNGVPTPQYVAQPLPSTANSPNRQPV